MPIYGNNCVYALPQLTVEMRAKKKLQNCTWRSSKFNFQSPSTLSRIRLLGSKIFCLSIAGFRSENNLDTDPILFSDPDMARLKGQGHEIITG